MLSAILVLLPSRAGELISAKDISLHLEVGRGCNTIRNKKKKTYISVDDNNLDSILWLPGTALE